MEPIGYSLLAMRFAKKNQKKSSLAPSPQERLQFRLKGSSWYTKWLSQNPLYKARMKLGRHSRDDAAVFIGVSATTIFKWEHGVNRPNKLVAHRDYINAENPDYTEPPVDRVALYCGMERLDLEAEWDEWLWERLEILKTVDRSDFQRVIMDMRRWRGGPADPLAPLTIARKRVKKKLREEKVKPQMTMR